VNDDAPQVAEQLVVQLAQQRALLESWVQSTEARRLAQTIIGRRGLSLSADELISEVWLRITRSFDARTEPLPSMSTIEEATRYGARIIDNLCRDISRKNLRRRETSLKVVMTGAGNEPAPTVKSTEGADTRILLEDQPIAVDGALRLRVLR
jgi:DNA-directed RNA polymerase specialized sigma24 family protein